MPVRVWIHSPVVSTIFSMSELVIEVSGAAYPTPMGFACIQIPRIIRCIRPLPPPPHIQTHTLTATAYITGSNLQHSPSSFLDLAGRGRN